MAQSDIIFAMLKAQIIFIGLMKCIKDKTMSKRRNVNNWRYNRMFHFCVLWFLVYVLYSSAAQTLSVCRTPYTCIYITYTMYIVVIFK